MEFKKKKLRNNRAVKIKSLGRILWDYGSYVEEEYHISEPGLLNYKFKKYEWNIDTWIRKNVLGKYLLIDGLNLCKDGGIYHIPNEWIEYYMVDDGDFEL